MQKIKRTDVRNSGRISTFFKVILILLLCCGMIAAGYFAASYFSKLF